jgi:hypothetical protein
MNAFWSYFWPIFGAGIVLGVIAGLAAFRAPRAKPKDREAAIERWRRRRRIALACGIAMVLAAAGLWHGPLGAAHRFTARVDRDARITLDNYEMFQVRAALHHEPLTRRMLLSGPADDFQRSELVRIIGSIPGVSSATWTRSGGGTPLIAEGAGLSLVGFLAGLVLAYLVELRRRYNAQWNW